MFIPNNTSLIDPFTEPGNPIFDDLQRAWQSFKESVLVLLPSPLREQLLTHITEAMCWGCVRQRSLNKMNQIIASIEKILDPEILSEEIKNQFAEVQNVCNGIICAMQMFPDMKVKSSPSPRW